MDNPFSYGTTATGDNFAGREEELLHLHNIIKLGESAVIQGQNGIGKTSLMTELARRNSRNFIFVRTDLTGVAEEGALFHVLTTETMRAGFGIIEDFSPAAWTLLGNQKLRSAVLEDDALGIQRESAPPQTAETAPPREVESVRSPRIPGKGEIRSCPTCGAPMKWVEKYDLHYCYSCKKYAPVQRRMRVQKRLPSAMLADQTTCPRCGRGLKFVHRYSAYFCQKCGKYPLLDLARTSPEKPTVADMTEALDLPEKVANLNATRVVVMLDEFQELASLENTMILSMMRRRFEMHGNVSYIFAGSNRQTLERMFEERSAPFRGFAQWIDLGGMAEEDLERFLMDRFKSAKGRLSREAASMIVDFSEGYPYYAQKIAHELFHITSTPSPEELERAVGAVLRHQSPAYSVLWDSVKSPLHRRYLMAVAHAPRVAHGQEFVRRYGLRSRSHVQRIEKQLEARGVVNRGEIVDPMLTVWLRSHSQGMHVRG